MENKRLFNWEVEKEIRDLQSKLSFKEVTLDEIETFILEHNYYNGEAHDVYVLLCNTYKDREYGDKADEVFHKLFEMWKVVSNKFPTNIKKINHLADLVISQINYVPIVFVTYLKAQPEEEMDEITGYIIGRYENYEKYELLNKFLEHVPYTGNRTSVIFKLINASVDLDESKVDNYIIRALESMKDPISFLNNIKFSENLFHAVTPETLQKILALPGINTKFHLFIQFTSFMEALDKIPTLSAKFIIDIANRLQETDVDMARQYGIRAIQKEDFLIEEHLPTLKCTCMNDSKGQPSVAELLLLSALKEGNSSRIWTIVENSYYKTATLVAQYETAIKYTGATIKISGGKSDYIAKHIQFLSRRMRSVDGPEGILEGDRYKYKEHNQKYSQQIDAFRTIYEKRTGKKFQI